MGFFDGLGRRYDPECTRLGGEKWTREQTETLQNLSSTSLDFKVKALMTLNADELKKISDGTSMIHLKKHLTRALCVCVWGGEINSQFFGILSKRPQISHYWAPERGAATEEGRLSGCV